MNWTDEIVIGETLLQLKEDDENIGFAGDIFLAMDFSIDLTDSSLKTIITSPIFNGQTLEKGVTTLIASDEQLMKKFIPMTKTFQELEKNNNDYFWNNIKYI